MIKRRKVPLSVIIPTKSNTDDLDFCLSKIKKCKPIPREVIVHIDGGDEKTSSWLKANYPNIRILKSEKNVGPGGGRNRLVKAASHKIIASFDDDSYPIDEDYFARVIEVFSTFPDADLVAAIEFTRNDSIAEATRQARWTCSFVGCACAYRRSAFLDTQGYLELPEFYGAEEQDLALQLSAQNRQILETDWLRIFHDTEYEDRGTNARAIWIANTALLVALRYPVPLFGYGLLQVLNSMLFAMQQGRPRAIFQALLKIPKKIWKHRHKRTPLPISAVWRYLKLRSTPEPVPWPTSEDDP